MKLGFSQGNNGNGKLTLTADNLKFAGCDALTRRLLQQSLASQTTHTRSDVRRGHLTFTTVAKLSMSSPTPFGLRLLITRLRLLLSMTEGNLIECRLSRRRISPLVVTLIALVRIG